jgi:hypothetical protein
MRDKTGGSAFPTPRFMVDKDARFTGFSVNTDGMSLRDYFAAKAMQTIYQKHWEMFMDETYDIPEDVRTGTAEEAYAIADEMLRARDA